MLLQHAPSGLDVRGLERSLTGIDGVQEVHDLHVWTLTSGMDVLSVHVLLAPGSRVGDLVRRDVHAVLREGWGISHATVQVEDVVDDNCLDLTW